MKRIKKKFKKRKQTKKGKYEAGVGEGPFHHQSEGNLGGKILLSPLTVIPTVF